MDACVKSCTILPSNDGTGAQGPVRRTGEKARHRFADVPALAALKEQVRSDRNASKKPTGSTQSETVPGTAETRKHSSRSVSDGSQATIGIDLSNSSAAAPVRTKKNAAKTGTATPVSSNTPTEAPPATVIQSLGQTGLAANTAAIGQAMPPRAVHIPTINASQTPQAKPLGAAGHATDAIGTSGLVKTKAQTAKPESANVDQQSPAVPTGEGGTGSDLTPGVDTGGKGQKKQAGAAHQSIESTKYAQSESGDKATPKIATLNSPVVARPLQDGSSSITQQRPDQASAKIPIAGRDSVTEASPRMPQRSSGVRSESQPRTAPKPKADDRGQKGGPGAANRMVEPKIEDSTVIRDPASILQNSPAAGGSRPSLEAQTSGTAEVPATQIPVRTVSEQILDSVRTSVSRGDGQILIRLEPPEMGTVVVRFQQQDEHLDGVLEVSRSETRQEIEQALPEVVQSLQEAGIQIRRLEVTGGDAPKPDLGSGQPRQDPWPGQQDSGQNREYPSGPPIPWSRGTTDHALSSQETPGVGHQFDPSGGGIDLLL